MTMNFIGSKQRVHRNIEFAHVKAQDLDKDLSEEHKASCRKLRTLLKQMEQEQENWCTVVLVDEYNSMMQGEHPLTGSFFQRLEDEACLVDFVAWESQLNASVSALLKELRRPRRRSNEDWLRKHERVPCSLRTATWYLIRLGALQVPTGLLMRHGNQEKPFVGEEITTIPPNYWEHNEDTARNILLDSTFRRYVGYSSYIFFETSNNGLKQEIH